MHRHNSVGSINRLPADKALLDGTGARNGSQAPSKFVSASSNSFVMFEVGSATAHTLPDVDLTSVMKGNVYFFSVFRNMTTVRSLICFNGHIL